MAIQRPGSTTQITRAGTSRAAPLLLALCLGGATGCAVPVAGGLDDGEANRVVVVLDRASVDATKETDPAIEGRWRVSVSRDDVPRALAAMHDEELPRRRPSSVLDAVGSGSLVPSEGAEHARLMAGIAGDIERSLQEIDGVLDARVHLSVPPPSPFRDAPPARPTASVLLEHRGATPPISPDAIQRLVAGGVSQLLPADVAVVLIARPAPPAWPGSELVHIGPIAVAHASLRQLQGALVALVALVAILAAATLALYYRLAQARAALDREAAAPRPEP